MRILIVEDEPLVAEDLAFIVEDLGHDVIGPFSSVAIALKSVDDAVPDFAFLDVNLGDGQAFPVADVLQNRSVPFAFCSAHLIRADTQKRYPDACVLSKPFRAADVEAAIADTTAL